MYCPMYNVDNGLCNKYALTKPAGINMFVVQNHLASNMMNLHKYRTYHI